eukprot:759904-Hanusia_phi.AAC.4
MESSNLHARDIHITLESGIHHDAQNLISGLDGHDVRRKTNLKSVVTCEFESTNWLDTSVDDAIDALYNPKSPFAYSRQKTCDDPFEEENIFDSFDVYFDDDCEQGQECNIPKTPTEASSSSYNNCNREGNQNNQGEQKCQVVSLYKTGHWSEEEHSAFLDALARFGPKKPNSGVKLGPGVAELIALAVKSRSVSQVRSHAQKYFKRNDAFACVARLQPVVGSSF